MSSSHSVKITSWNVLSKTMCDTRFFAESPHLDWNNRIPLINSEIRKLIESDQIIVLQEVDIDIASKLHTIFSEHDYYPLTAHYSTMPGRNYFGTMIAFPKKIYQLQSYGQQKIGEYIKTPDNIAELHLTQPNNGKKMTETVYQEAQKRDSALLYAYLTNRVTGLTFAVFTYHMPCAFWWLPVMTLHADALFIQITKLAGELPFILAGDFNTLPNTPLYNFYTTGSATELEIMPYPDWKPTERTRKVLDTRVKFEYVKTTQCTNSKGDLFEGTIDYIFYSEDFEVSSFTVQPITENLPSSTMPSDHVPINAEFTIKSAGHYFL